MRKARCSTWWFTPSDVLWILPQQYRPEMFPVGFPFRVDEILWQIPAPQRRVVVYGRMLNPCNGWTIRPLVLLVWWNQPGSVRTEPSPVNQTRPEPDDGELPRLARPFVDHGRLHGRHSMRPVA